MVVNKIALLAAVSVLGLSACNDNPIGDGSLFSSWNREAGSFIDEGGFGNATMRNTQIQNGELSYIVDLNQRFTNDVVPMVNFAFDSARLDADAQAVLRRQATWIRQFPEVRFKVFGHTDLVGPNAYNRRLGLRRARAVVRYLTTQGISRSRLQAVTSFGETQPLIVTETRERRNRRTVTEVSGLVGRRPANLNGKYAELIFREYVESATEKPTNDTNALQDTAGSGG